MNLDAIPLFAMLKGRLGYLGEREKVLAENIANSSTPGYAPRDTKPFMFQPAMMQQGASARPGGGAGGGLAMTSPQHLPLTQRQSRAAGARAAADSEVTLDGNAVVLEEQMIKLSEARIDYDAAIGFYQKSLALLRTAARAPSK